MGQDFRLYPEDGLYFRPLDVRLMGSCEIVATVADATSKNHALLVLHRGGVALVPSGIRQSPSKLAAHFEQHGIGCERNATVLRDGSTRIKVHDLISRFFVQARPRERRIRVRSAGWHRVGARYAFVLADGTVYGAPGVIFAEPVYHPRWGQRGTLTEWQAHIVGKARGNSRTMLAICVSLSGPLIETEGMLLNGRFNSFGSSHTERVAYEEETWG